MRTLDSSHCGFDFVLLLLHNIYCYEKSALHFGAHCFKHIL
jgi:hypothetical protein